MRTAFALALLVSATGLLLLIGYGLSVIPDFCWDPRTSEYLRALAPEVGGSGLGAFIVGGVAGYVASLLGAEREFSAFKRGLARQRELKRPLKLTEVTKRWQKNLPLQGFAFRNEGIADISLSDATFHGDQSAVDMVSITFTACDLHRVQFGPGGYLSQVSFVTCRLSRCCFVGVKLSGSHQAFEASTISKCRFDRAAFERVNLEGGVFTRCTFWGASFKDSALPAPLHGAMERAGLLVVRGAKEFQVQSMLEALTSLTPTKAVFLLSAVGLLPG